MDNFISFSIGYIMTFLCSITFVISISNIIEYKYQINIKNIITIVLISVILTIPSIFEMGLLKELISATILIIYIRYLSHISFKKIAIAYLIIDSISIVIELIFGFILKSYENIMQNFMQYQEYFKAIITIIIVINIYIFSIVLKKIKIYVNFSWSFVCIIFLLFFIIATLNYNVVIKSNQLLYLLFIILILIIGFIIVLGLKVSYKNKHMKQEIKNLNDKNEECIKYIDEFKKYKHNLRYDLIAAQQYGNAKINKILNEIINKGDSDIEYINNLKNIPSSLLSIFMDRLSFALNESYTVVINNDLHNNEVNISKSSNYIKMCEITGNILTNAIEALPDKNGVLVINFYEIDGNKYLEVVNNFKNVIDIDNLGKLKYSTKSRKSGYGLSGILNEKNFEPQISIKNNFFIIKIKIPK